jgi:hypothetical protein
MWPDIVFIKAVSQATRGDPKSLLQSEILNSLTRMSVYMQLELLACRCNLRAMSMGRVIQLWNFRPRLAVWRLPLNVVSRTKFEKLGFRTVARRFAPSDSKERAAFN